MAWMIPFAGWFVALRGFTAALSRPGMAMLVMWLAVAANVPLNWVFIYGNLGVPAMGIEGAAVASILVNVLMCAGLLAAIQLDPWLRGWNVAARLWRWPHGQLRRVLSVGLPIGGTLVVEVGVFAGAALIIGLLGETELAAHGVVMQIAATAFMVPLGIGLAACTRVGASWGAASPDGARRAAWIAPALAGGVMTVSAAILLLAPDRLIGIFIDLDDPASAAVIEQARALLVVAAVFQIVDGLQVTQQNALRGIGDVRWPFVISLAGYWGIGLGAGSLLAFPVGLGAAGVGWGMAAGLASVSALLGLRMLWQFRSGGVDGAPGVPRVAGGRA